MHFEILVEDQSGKKALNILVPKIIGEEHSFRIHPYKGIGHIPKGMDTVPNPSNYLLLNNLPAVLRAYGKAYPSTNKGISAAVIVVCDLDDKCLKTFRRELLSILNNCRPKPETRFCIAIEEGEAWLLGDLHAIKLAYPKAKDKALQAYENDSICNTWEVLADAVTSGGSQALAQKGWHAVGLEKSRWAEAIAPHMDVDKNQSPSFQYFCTKLRELTGS